MYIILKFKYKYQNLFSFYKHFHYNKLEERQGPKVHIPLLSQSESTIVP